MKLDALLAFLADEFSGVRAKNTVARIAGFHRIQASPGYDDAVRYIVSELQKLHVEHTVSTFAADGKTATFGWISPPGWSIRSGRLTQIDPSVKRLGTFSVVKQSVLGQSAPGDAEGEVVHVGAGDSEGCFDGLDLRNKFVLTSGRATTVLRHLKGKGAAGIIIYPDTERAAPSHDLVQYAGFFPRADELEGLPMGFSISRRAADGLLKDLDKGMVCVRGRVDAEFIEHPMQVLEATIGGTDAAAGAVLLSAHLCHPEQSANDNASGSGTLVEVARVLAELANRGELANTVRLVWVPEFNGTVPWVAANAEKLRDVAFAINLDMVGQSPEIIGEPLRAFRVPNSHPVFLNACFEPLLSAIANDARCLAAQGSRRPLHWILDAPTGGSDHLVFQAPPTDIPSMMLGHDDPYWHTDLDTIEKVDPTRLKQVGILTAALSLLPTWAQEEAWTISEWLMAFSQRALTQASRLARDAGGCVARRLLDTSWAIETSRAQSLASFLGHQWDPAAHLRALETTHEVLAGHLSQVEDDGSQEVLDQVRPRRTLHGPVRSDVIRTLTQDDRAFLEATLQSNHGIGLQLLANLANGTRTADGIAACLSLDLDRVVAASDVVRATKILEQVGYVTTGN
jgi:aminopeptidase YwaD